MAQQKILLAHLNSNGDCLYATVIARQIKEVDYPGCHLTWAVNSNCKKSILLNPYVDDIWEFPTKTLLATEKEWASFTRQAEKRKKKGDFDIIFYTQIIGKNLVNIDGGIRSSIYNNYPHPVTVPKVPVIRLSDEEVGNVKAFAQKHQLSTYKHVILLECGPDSFKSALNPDSAVDFATKFSGRRTDVAFILSSSKKINSNLPDIIDGSVVSFRENAELTKYCTLFIGCSSGISWLTTTDWAKPLPKIIIAIRSNNFSYSMVFDHEYAGLPIDKIIEFPEHPGVLEELNDCVGSIMEENFETARKKFHNPFKIKNYKYIYILSRMSFSRWDFISPITALRRNIKKNGFNKMEMLYFLKAYAKLPGYVFQNAIKAAKKRIK